MGRIIRTAGNALAEALWPTRCFGCERPGTLLCADCSDALPVIDQRTACPRCGAPFGSLVCTECTRCLSRGADGDDALVLEDGLAELDGVRCYGLHAWPLDNVVRGYKDGGERRASELLAEMLGRAVQGFGETAAWDGVTFVPCTPAAFARRGHDHMEAVASGVGERLGLPVADVLACRAPRDQRGLSRDDRAANVRGSLVALAPLEGARLLLVDDVLTTGATLSAAAGVLRQAGAEQVDGACVVRAW